MTHYPLQHDPEFYPSPLTFDELRFFNLRKAERKGDKHQFASLTSSLPQWGVDKFACPGRFWASGQIKLLLMVLLLKFEIGYPEGQTERPKNKVVEEKNQVSLTQRLILKRRE